VEKRDILDTLFFGIEKETPLANTVEWKANTGMKKVGRIS